ncbi:hypothetical protein Pelo_9151 [Pelomyxa schiedti]|nr:hypothetical protein Pelo_9151 [Pelomyxa schiedti]
MSSSRTAAYCSGLLLVCQKTHASRIADLMLEISEMELIPELGQRISPKTATMPSSETTTTTATANAPSSQVDDAQGRSSHNGDTQAETAEKGRHHCSQSCTALAFGARHGAPQCLAALRKLNSLCHSRAAPPPTGTPASAHTRSTEEGGEAQDEEGRGRRRGEGKTEGEGEAEGEREREGDGDGDGDGGWLCGGLQRVLMWTHVCPLDVAAVADFATREQAGSGDYGSGCVYRLQVYPVEYLREIGTGLVGHHLKMHAKSYTHSPERRRFFYIACSLQNTRVDNCLYEELIYSQSDPELRPLSGYPFQLRIPGQFSTLEPPRGAGHLTFRNMREEWSPKVIHIQKPLDESLHDLHALNSHFHIVCCDMNCTPSQIPGVLSRVLHMMHNGSYFIATLKFQHKPPSIAQPDVANAIADTVSALGFKEVKVVWLIANSCNERTLIAQKSA